MLLALFIYIPVPPAHAFAGDYALEFDGETDWASLDRAVNIIGTDWLYTKTVSLWVRPTSAAPITTTIANSELIFGDQPRWFGIYWANIDGSDKIWVWNSPDSSEDDRIGIPNAIGEWAHITLVHANTQLHAYKNGVLVGTIATGPTAEVIINGSGGITQTNGFRLRFGGTSATSYEVNFAGQIDEISIWSEAKTADEIRQMVYRTLNGTESGLAAYYSMSNGSGSSVTDNSGNGHNASLLDGLNPHIPSDGDTAAWVASGAFAGPRNALAFAGGDDVVALNANANTILGGSWASAKTAELWAYPTGTAPVVGSAAAGDILIGNAHWGIARAIIDSADRLWLYNNDGNEDPIGIPYASGEWAHIALVHDGTNLNAYKNGTLVGSVPSGSTANDANLLIGSGFEGQLDELRLWDSARSAAAIQENMFRTLAHDTSGLAAYYRFDQENDGTVTTVYDTAVSSRHGTMTNMDPANDWVASAAFNTWIGSQSSDWADGANWSRYAAPTAADNVGIYNYPASNPPEISDGRIANSVLIATGATLTVNSGGTLRADGLWFNLGTLANAGTLEQRQAVDGSAPVQFFADGNYGPITIDGNSFDLGGTTVRVRALANCTAGGPEQTVQRCIDIAPDNSPDSSNSDPGSILTFSFLSSELSSNDCSTLNAFHWNGSSWDMLTRDNSFGTDGRQCTTEPYQLQVTGVTDFSPFMLTSENNPTAVSLQTITAQQSGWWASLLASSLLLVATGGLLMLRRKKQRQAI
jgi:hypothetical protein